MIMSSHQAIGVDDTVKSLMGFSQSIKKSLIIALIMKNRLPGTATIHYMIKGVFLFNALRSGHGESIDKRVL